MKISPIDTRYKDFRFRSRLEARWAVFFDTAGIEWEYEKEGFDLEDDGYYLPDFYLPKLSTPTWVEIKPDVEIPEHELSKVIALKDRVSCLPENASERVVIILGQPYIGKYKIYHPEKKLRYMEVFGRCPLCERIDIISGCSIENVDIDSIECMWCDVVDRNTGENDHAEFHKGSVISKKQYPILLHPSLKRAYRAARGARFEHGEEGT